MDATRAEFLSRLAAALPNLAGTIRPDEAESLPGTVAALRRATEAAVDGDRAWEAERHFRFVEDVLWDADPELRTALEDGYLRGLALGAVSAARDNAFYHRMPASLRAVLVRYRAGWR